MTLARYPAALLASVLALAAASAPAQAPRPAAPVQVPGVSPAGNAVIQRLSGKPDPAGTALMNEAKGMQQQLVAVLNAPTLDLDRLDAALKRKQAFQARVMAFQDARTLTLLRALPPTDRKPFLAAVSQRPAQGR